MNPKTAARPQSDANCNVSLLSKVKRYVQQQDYAAALQLLGNPGYNTELRNARGVCLLRLGCYTEAIQWYRATLLRSGSITMRSDLPTYLKTNFATALLLAGQIEGCISALTEAQDDRNPVVVRLQSNLKKWAKQLTMGQWLSWKFGTLDPAHANVTLDFAPGVFEDDLITELSVKEVITRHNGVQAGAPGCGI